MVVFIQVLANSNQINFQFYPFQAPAAYTFVAVVIFYDSKDPFRLYRSVHP